MPDLHEIQREFARFIQLGNAENIETHIVSAGLPAADRLGIYRNTARSATTAALRLTFPVVDRLVGGDFFDMATARFMLLHPPVAACLDDYGDLYPDFLSVLPEAASLPYLSDVARFEWALAVAAHAPDSPPAKAAALAEASPIAAEQLRFEPHPSVSMLLLTYPADRIADAVLSSDAGAMAAIDLTDGPIRLIVHRGPTGVEAERVNEQTYTFLARLYAREPLAVLLADAEPDAAQILARQLVLGRLTGFSVFNDWPMGKPLS
jgi:hypothetical protein